MTKFGNDDRHVDIIFLLMQFLKHEQIQIKTERKCQLKLNDYNEEKN